MSGDLSTQPIRITIPVLVCMIRSASAGNDKAIGESPGVASKFLVQLGESLGVADPALQRLLAALVVILTIMAVIVVTLLLHHFYAMLFRDDYRNIRRFELPLHTSSHSHRHANRSHEPSARLSKRRRNLPDRSGKLIAANGGISTSQHFLGPSVDNSLINVTGAQAQQQQTQSSFHSMFGDAVASRGDEQTSMAREGSDASGAFSRPHYPSLDIIVN